MSSLSRKSISEPLSLSQPNIIYYSLGTTRAEAGSAEAFERIDRECVQYLPERLSRLTTCRYVLAAAKAAKSSGTQRVIYISSGSANKNSLFLYSRSKGLTEEGLASLGYSDTIIFRPGFLAGVSRNRIAERIFRLVSSKMNDAQVLPTFTVQSPV